MKRARPKNKKAAIKREREFYEQERAARSAQHYDEPENTDEYTEPETQPQNVNKYENIIEEIQHERAETGSVSPEEPRPRYSQPAVSAQSGAKGKPVKGKKKKKKHRALKIILTVLVVFVALGFITMGLDIFDDSDVLTPLENGKIIVLMLGVIYTLKVIDIILGLTHGGPANATETIATQSYERSFVEFAFGEGAALSNILIVVSSVFAVVYPKGHRA